MDTKNQGGIPLRHRVSISLLLTALVAVLTIPASALLQSEEEPAVDAFAKNGTTDSAFVFSQDDFVVRGDYQLSSLILESLPDAGAGLLKLGAEVLHVGDSISVSAVEGLRFYPLAVPTVADTEFSFTPVFSDGSQGAAVTVSLYVLAAENSPPIAENLTLSTYKNVAVEGQFAAVDPEGDLLTFRLISKPARGQVTLNEDGTFVYTPYDNKTGKDSFTYAAVDSVGNVSTEATVKITISKAKSGVTYADMEGNTAHCAAIRLAEEGILVGYQMDGDYYFQPDLPVTREEFLALAMSAAGLDELEGITLTGFADDAAISVWAKGYVSSALRSGLVTGSPDEQGAPCFSGSDAITLAQAAVLMDRILDLTDVSSVDALGEAVPSWASQSVANLSAVSVLSGSEDVTSTLTRADAAQLLCSMLDVLERRETGWV